MLKTVTHLLKFAAGSQYEDLRWLEPNESKDSRSVPRGVDSYD